MQTKVCKVCGVEKELSSFYPHPKGPDGYFAACRSCVAIRNNEWKRKNPEAAKAIQKRSRSKNGRRFYENQVEKRKQDWKKYSDQRRKWDAVKKKPRHELAEKLNLLQAGLCAICDDPIDIYDVDHSHETGLVRGLLCRKCNSGLHYLESERFIKRATAYLKDYPASKFPPVKY